MIDNIPAGHAICPVCNGTTRVPAPAEYRRYTCLVGYDRETETLSCHNCGGQTMGLRALGYVKIDPSTGQGCAHEFVGESHGRCYTVYACQKCGWKYDIDSSD